MAAENPEQPNGSAEESEQPVSPETVSDSTDSSSELGSLLTHELQAPVEFELSGVATAAHTDEHSAELASVHSFHDLFERPAPPLPLLRMTKDFAEAHLVHPESPMVKEVARSLYYASIALASTRHRSRVTELSNEELTRGFEWCLAQSWMEPQLRRIFSEAIACLVP
jgi:hypothetical protein